MSSAAHAQPLPANPSGSTEKTVWDQDRYAAGGGVHTSASRKSIYVPVRDKTRLAVDFYLPAADGTRKFSTIFLYTRYSRGSTNPDGSFTSTEGLKVDRDGVARLDIGGADDATQSGSVAQFLRHGYAVVIAEMRGAGASFGPQHHEGDDVEGRDGKDLVDWIARQPWSNGRVGMFGTSYLAEVQPRVAALKPAPLKALVMVQGFFDGANSAYAMGGIHRSGWAGAWQAAVARLDSLASAAKARAAITPVDADADRRLLREAIEQHQQEPAGTDYRTYSADFTGIGVLRDTLGFIDRYQAVGANNLSTLVPKFNAANVPTLLIGGWEDLYVTDMMLWNANISVPHKLIYGPWGHGGALGPGLNPRNLEFRTVRTTEALRWFDHWLKQMPNDAMEKPAIRLEVAIDQKQAIGLSSDTWPLPGTRTISYYLSPGRTGTVQSQNDGALSVTAPQRSLDNWVVDYGTSLGTAGTRWEYKRIYPIAMLQNDLRSLTYTSDPIETDMLVAGSPSLSLWLSSENAPVVDIYAYLSEVDPDGTSRLVTEGMIRSSHRTLGPAPYDNLGRPFPTSNAADVAAAPALNGDATLIRFPMLVTGKVFRAGSRIRVTISGNDKGNTTTPILDTAPKLKMFLGGATLSQIELPIAPLGKAAATAESGR